MVVAVGVALRQKAAVVEKRLVSCGRSSLLCHQCCAVTLAVPWTEPPVTVSPPFALSPQL